MVRPIDLQDNLSKAPLVGRVQQEQEAAADLAQRQAALEGDRRHVLDQSRTLPMPQAEGKTVNPDGSRPESEERRRRHVEHRAEDDDAASAPAGPDAEGHIDIVV